MSGDTKRAPKKRLKNVMNVRTDDEFKAQLEALRRNELSDRIPSRSDMVRMLVNRAYQHLKSTAPSAAALRLPQAKARTRS